VANRFWERCRIDAEDGHVWRPKPTQVPVWMRLLGVLNAPRPRSSTSRISSTGRADTFGRAWLVIRDFFNERVLRA